MEDDNPRPAKRRVMTVICNMIFPATLLMGLSTAFITGSILLGILVSPVGAIAFAALYGAIADPEEW